MANERQEARPGESAPRRTRGFTLIELAIVIAVVGVVTALGVASWRSAHPRAQLLSTAAELESAIKLAQRKALASGRDVAVMFFPQQGTGGGGFGRVIVLLDGDGGFMDGTGATRFCGFPSDRYGPGPAGTRNEIVTEVNFPRGVSIGTPVAAPRPVFPYTTVPTSVTGCSFCDAGLVSGAIRFDPRGQASFYTNCGAPLPNPPHSGGSIVVNSITRSGDAVEVRGSSVLMVLPNGLVRSFHAG